MAEIALTLIGGPTVLLEWAGLRLLTDPTFDPAGTSYQDGPVELRKLVEPAMTAEELGGVDAVLLSHDQHFDNFDHAGRELVARLGAPVLTTPEGALRLGGFAVGLELGAPYPLGGLTIEAVGARHGPPGSEPLTGPVTGFLLRDAARRSIYISGDTVDMDAMSELGQRHRIDLAILHTGAAGFAALGPAQLSLDAAGAAEATRRLGAARVALVHADGWEHLHEDRLTAERKLESTAATRLVPLTPGERATVRLD